MSEDNRLENLVQNLVNEVSALTQAWIEFKEFYATSQFKPASETVAKPRPATPTPKQTETASRWEKYPLNEQDLMNNILKLKPNLSTDALINLVEGERAKSAGLLTSEAAIHLVANNLGLGEPSKPVGKAFIPERGEILALVEGWTEGKYGKSAKSSDHPELIPVITESNEERLDYGDFYLKLGGDMDVYTGEKPFLNFTWRKFHNPDAPPSAGQLKYAEGLGIDCTGLTVKQVSVAISEALLEKRRV